MNKEKQIDYWTRGSDSDIDTAEILIEKNKILNSLFFCHLSVEKILKANVVKSTSSTPPKTHNLIYLCDLAKINLQDDHKFLLSILTRYQIEGRYPVYNPDIPPLNKAKEYLHKTRELLKCLKKIL